MISTLAQSIDGVTNALEAPTHVKGKLALFYGK